MDPDLDNISEHFLIGNELLENRDFLLSPHDILVLPLFISIIIIGIFGNCLVCLAIYTNRYTINISHTQNQIPSMLITLTTQIKIKDRK